MCRWILILQWRSLQLYSQLCWASLCWFLPHLVFTAAGDGASRQLAIMEQLYMRQQRHRMASIYGHFIDVNAGLFHLFVTVIWTNNPPVLMTMLRWSVQFSPQCAPRWSVDMWCTCLMSVTWDQNQLMLSMSGVPLPYQWSKKFAMLNHGGVDHKCDRRMDGRTDWTVVVCTMCTCNVSCNKTFKGWHFHVCYWT